MADVLVQGDTGPLISGVIHEKDDPDSPIDLSNASVKFQMRRVRDQNLMVNALATLSGSVNPASGEVSYMLEPNDTAIPGDYQYQWQVTFPDGRKQTTYEPKLLTIRKR